MKFITPISMVLALTFLTACGESSSNLMEEQTSPTLAVVGDSLSTGVLASTSFGSFPSNQLYKKFLEHAIGMNYDAAVFQEKFSEPENAAATTTKEWGIRSKIAQMHGMSPARAEDVKTFFAANFGGRLMHVDGHLQSLEEQYGEQNGGKPADYLLFMLGGNNFCAGDSVEQFAENFEKSLRKTISKHKNSTIIVSAVPPIPRFHETDYTYRRGPFALTSCKQMRKNYCAPIYSPDVGLRWMGFNKAIKDTVETLSRRLTTKIRYVAGVASMKLTENELSFDCFHPSLDGQREIATMLRESMDNL